MNVSGLLWAAVLLVGGTQTASADGLNYRLVPRKVADDTYVFIGTTEDFDSRNGGNIVNTGFIVTDEGVLVIDTGPSRLYGEQMREAIARVTSQPIRRVLNTHHHPDHFFGNQAFADVPIAALSTTIAGMRAEGGPFSDNLYRMSGEWMKGTESHPATVVAEPGRFDLGGHELELIALHGHTQGDLVLLDRTTGVLFAGDLVFFRRAPTTPHADIDSWLNALDQLQRVPRTLMVPGHGEPVSDDRALNETRDYLNWLKQRLQQAARNGLDMPELLTMPLPAEYAAMPMAQTEYRRSIAHLFRGIEIGVLGTATREEPE